MDYDFGRRITLHEEVKFVPIQEFSSAALVKPFEEDTCSCEDEPGYPSLIKGHPIEGNVSSDFRTEVFP